LGGPGIYPGRYKQKGRTEKSGLFYFDHVPGIVSVGAASAFLLEEDRKNKPDITVFALLNLH
jgi:hypothetical protein